MTTHTSGSFLWAWSLPILLFAVVPARASHIIGTEINVRFVADSTYEVTLKLWRDCFGVPLVQSEVVNYESPCGLGSLNVQLQAGSPVEVSTICPADLINTTCNGGTLPGVELYIYTGLAQLTPCNAWTISWSTTSFYGANNLVANEQFHVRATLNNADEVCISTARFEQRALPVLFNGAASAFDLHGVHDGAQDISFALVGLLQPGGTPVAYVPPYSGTMPYDGMTIDPMTGWISVPGSGPLGNYAMDVQATVTDSSGTVLSTIERCYGMVVLPFTNNMPPVQIGAIQNFSGTATTTGARSVELWPGQDFCFDLVYNDADAADSLTITSDIQSVLPGSGFVVTGGNPATAAVCWQAPNNAAGIKRFLVTASDGHCPLDGRQTYLYTVLVLPTLLDPCTSVGLGEVNDASGNTMQVLPNPNAGVFDVTVPQPVGIGSLALYDLHGRLLMPLSVGRNGSPWRVELPAGIANGTYLVRNGPLYARIVLVR